jgi:hypothetical protein
MSRHVFKDGSAVVESELCWDIEGEKPFSRAGSLGRRKIFVREWPHQGRVREWMANDREDFISKVRASIEQKRKGDNPMTYDECCDFLASDLSLLEVDEL